MTGLALWWIRITNLDANKVNLTITAVICAVTTVYALITYEMLLQNQTMAKAALDSSSLMEKSLRFSHTPSVLYKTITTKEPSFSTTPNVLPVDNEDYKRAMSAYLDAGGQAEFVFAIVSNKGQGAATNLSLEATYTITDSSNLNRESTISKRASVQIVEPNTAVALCIFISKIPTPGDGATLVSAQVVAGDFYRDAIGENPQHLLIEPKAHHFEPGANSLVWLA